MRTGSSSEGTAGLAALTVRRPTCRPRCPFTSARALVLSLFRLRLSGSTTVGDIFASLLPWNWLQNGKARKEVDANGNEVW